MVFRGFGCLAPLISVTILSLCTPAAALDGGWAETEGARMRLVVDPARGPDGRLEGVLDIELAPGWKTYWKEPGGSGIPPAIDLAGSTGIALDAMRLPAPQRVDDGYSVWAGYRQSVRFALEFSASGAARLEANVFIGVCEKICVPFQAAFSLPVPAPAEAGEDTEAARLVAMTRLALPEPASPGFAIAPPLLDAGAMTLTVTAELPEAGPADATPDLFVAGPRGWAFAPPRLVAVEGRRATFAVPVEGMPKDEGARAGPLDLVVTHGSRAAEATLAVE
jgi:Uncharacterized protein predicted to be involved in C-type cytochrome biogenesis